MDSSTQPSEACSSTRRPAWHSQVPPLESQRKVSDYTIESRKKDASGADLFASEIAERFNSSRQAFLAMDKNKDGTIGKEELRERCQRWNIPLHAIDDILDKADVDDDGNLNFHEVAEMFGPNARYSTPSSTSSYQGPRNPMAMGISANEIADNYYGDAADCDPIIREPTLQDYVLRPRGKKMKFEYTAAEREAILQGAAGVKNGTYDAAPASPKISRGRKKFASSPTLHSRVAEVAFNRTDGAAGRTQACEHWHAMFQDASGLQSADNDRLVEAAGKKMVSQNQYGMVTQVVLNVMTGKADVANPSPTLKPVLYQNPAGIGQDTHPMAQRKRTGLGGMEVSQNTTAGNVIHSLQDTGPSLLNTTLRRYKEVDGRAGKLSCNFR